MEYVIAPDQDLQDELRRIALEQADRAVAGLDDPDDDLVAKVHDCRKRCKKVRGVLRLVRPAIGDQYEHANAAFRDAARELGPLRDAHALLATFETLVEAHREHARQETMHVIRDALERRASEASAAALEDRARVAKALDHLEGGSAIIDDLRLSEEGFDAIAEGLAKTYRRGRRALAEASAAPTVAAFHEYRKRTKYTWYHVRLLALTAPSITEPLGRRLHGLSDALGDDHDLAVLGEQLLDRPEDFGGADRVAEAMIIVDGQRADLQRRALALGARLHAERPEAFARRFEAYWSAWMDRGRELPCGDIADLAGL